MAAALHHLGETPGMALIGGLTNTAEVPHATPQGQLASAGMTPGPPCGGSNEGQHWGAGIP